MTVHDVFVSIKPANTYTGMLHNNLKLYRAMKYNPESKVVKRMFMEGHLNLFGVKQRWRFAKAIYKQSRERWDVV